MTVSYSYHQYNALKEALESEQQKRRGCEAIIYEVCKLLDLQPIAIQNPNTIFDKLRDLKKTEQ